MVRGDGYRHRALDIEHREVSIRTATSGRQDAARCMMCCYYSASAGGVGSGCDSEGDSVGKHGAGTGACHSSAVSKRRSVVIIENSMLYERRRGRGSFDSSPMTHRSYHFMAEPFPGHRSGSFGAHLPVEASCRKKREGLRGKGSTSADGTPQSFREVAPERLYRGTSVCLRVKV